MSLRIIVCLLLVAAATAQGQRSKPPATSSTALHRAWLQEVLDLDSAGASQSYAEIAADDRPFHFARWIAVARLAELQRVKVASGTQIDYRDAPTPLRPVLTEPREPLDVDQLLESISADPATLFDRLATEQQHVPPLRPFVLPAEAWVVDQIGPSRIERFRRRLAAPDTRPPLTSRVFAARVLRAELQDRTGQAEELRSLYFRPWLPPAASEDPAVDVARVRHNLAQLLQEREWTGYWSGLHRSLNAKFEELAAEDPAAAVALVRRVPQYAERLLAPIPAQNR